MPDPRWDALAETLIHHSTRLAAGETLLIECFDLEDSTLPRLLVQKAARRGAYPLVETKDSRLVRELVKQRLRGPDARLGRLRAPPDGARRRLHRPPRGAQHQRDGRRPRREDEPVQHPLPQARPLRVPDQADEVVRPPPPQREHGAAGRDEHRGVRELLLRRLQPRLHPARPGPAAPRRADDRGARGPHHGPRDRPAVLDRGDPGRPLRRRDEHPRRRGLHRPGARLGRGPRPVQHADDLPGELVRRRPPRIPRRAGSSRPTAPAATSRSSAASSRPTRGPTTSASGRSAATPASCTRCATSSSTRRSPGAST